MRTIRIHLAAVFGLALAPALASAQDAPTDPAPADPAVGEPAPAEAAPVPAATEPPGNPAAAGATVAAAPEDTGTVSTEVAPSEAPSSIINLDVEGASAYVWRGMNLFGESQDTQNFSVFPSLTATFGALSIGYWGAFQVTGDNKSELVNSGVGAEQDFILKYVDSIAEGVGYTAMLTYWIYPLADADDAGTDAPMFLEPLLGVTYASAVDLGLNASYYVGLQDATSPYSFFYINPSIGKTLALSGDISLALGLSGGYKIFTDDGTDDPDKAFDLTLNAGVTLPFSDMYITPQVHAAFVSRADNPTTGDEQFIAWAGVHVGYNIGL